MYGDLTWTSPVAISTALTNASDPHVVLDANNNATAIWVENNVIKSSSLPSGGSWTVPITLSNPLNTSASPKIAVDGSGNVTALWIESNQIESSILPFGGSWSAETSPISSSGATNPVLAVNSSGTAVAIWSLGPSIQSSTRISGTWNPPFTLAASNASNPHIAISDFGTAIAAWHAVSSGSDIIITNILTLSINTWGTSKNVFPATASFQHNYPQVALDSNGNATVAWFRYNLVNGNAYQNVQVLTSILTQGATNWAIGVALSNPGIRNPADLTIKLKYDGSGNTLLVWTNSYDGEIFSIESSQRLFGITLIPSFYSFGIDTSIASGTGLLTNMSWDGVSELFIQAQQTDTTEPFAKFWTPGKVISTGNENGYPSCSMSVTGSTLNAVAVWINFDGSNLIINAAIGSDSVINPPSSVSATQSTINLGVYNDYANTITWSASTEPNLILYNIYRNGVYFASASPSTLSFVDHNQALGGTVTYGVAALNSEFRQSQIITYTIFP